MNGAIADPAVSTISTPKVSKIKISGNNQNFFLTRRKPQRSLMNSIIVLLLIRFLYIFSSENMISNDHYRIFTRLEVLQFQGIKAQKLPCQANRSHYAKENQRQKDFGDHCAQQVGETQPQNGHRPIKLRKRHVYDESDDRNGNKSFPFESAAEEQKQKHHGHAGVFALLFRDGSLKQFGDDFFHTNSILADDAPPTLLVHSIF